MHELAIAQELSGIVLDTAVKEKLTIVSRVNVIFGKMIQVVPEIFEFAFRVSVKDSVAAKAELSIEIVPVRIKCRACGNESEIKDNSFICNSCGSRDVDLVQGREIYIKSIEGE